MGSGRTVKHVTALSSLSLMSGMSPLPVRNIDSSAPFGVKNSRSFLVLDKSFLDGASLAQLLYYAQNGWTFAISEALMYELLSKRDNVRIAGLFKLQRIEKSLAVLPSIGEMFRAEAGTLKPASSSMKAKAVELIAEKDAAGNFFSLTGDSLLSVQERTADLKEKVSEVIEMWRDLGRLPALKEAHPTELRAKADELSLAVRNDREAMRGFYGNLRHSFFPAADLIDGEWTYFRWIQVYLVAGLDFYCSYGAKTEPSRDKIFNELLDLDYLIMALLAGGLASREKRFLKRFRLLRPDGVLLRN